MNICLYTRTIFLLFCYETKFWFCYRNFLIICILEIVYSLQNINIYIYIYTYIYINICIYIHTENVFVILILLLNLSDNMHLRICLFPSIYICMNICLYIHTDNVLLCRGRINVTILCKGWVLHSRRKKDAAANDVYVSLIFTLLCVI